MKNSRAICRTKSKPRSAPHFASRTLSSSACATAVMILIAGACRAEPPSLPENLSVAWSPPRVINDDGRGVVQFDPALSTAPDGSVHAAWVDFRDGAGVFGLYHARRPAAGDAWEHNERVSDLIGAVCRDDPDVAIDSAGAVDIVWSDYRNVHPDIFVSTKAPGAGAWSAPRVVNDDTTETIQWSPAIAADHEGGVWVTWSDYRDGDGAIYASRRDVDGSWTPNERVDDAPAGQQDRPAIAIAPTGEVFVAWHDMRDDLGDVSAARRDPLTGEWSRAVRLNALPEGRQASPTLAIDAGGVVIAAWYDEHDSATIHAATLDPSVGASDATAATGASGVSGATDASGATGASGERTYSDDWSESRRVSSPTGRIAERPAAAAGAGTALVTWYEHIGIDGVIMASERLPGIGTGWSAPERIDGSGGSSAGRNPAAVIAPDGRAHIAWYGEGDLRQKEIFHSTSEIEEPESFEAEGRLIYSTGRDTPGCPADGFTLVGCDGERHVLVAAGAKVEAQLDAALGRIVRVAGVTRAGIGDAEICRLAHVMAIDVDPAACAGGGVEPPPPPGTGAIVGRVFVSALASPGGLGGRDRRPAHLGRIRRPLLRRRRAGRIAPYPDRGKMRARRRDGCQRPGRRHSARPAGHLALGRRKRRLCDRSPRSRRGRITLWVRAEGRAAVRGRQRRRFGRPLRSCERLERDRVGVPGRVGERGNGIDASSRIAHGPRRRVDSEFHIGQAIAREVRPIAARHRTR